MAIRKFNARFLETYGENCRASLSEVGKVIRRSPQNASYVIASIDHKTNPVYYTIVDYSYLGLLKFMVYFRGGFSQPSDLNKIVDGLCNTPSVTSLYEIGGQYDLLVHMMAKNPSRFNKELKSLIAIQPELKNYDVVINVVEHIYPRRYLQSSMRRFDDIIIGGDREQLMLAEKQRQVLKEIIDNPRTRLTAIANSTGLNIKTVRTALRALERQKIIQGYKCDFNLQYIIRNMIVLKIHNVSVEKESQLRGFCAATPEIIGFRKTIGSWDVEIDLETYSSSQFREIYLSIRETFREIIQTFNYFQIFRTYKKRFVPDDFFEIPRNS